MMLTVVLEGKNFNTTTFFTTSIPQLYMLELQFSVIQHDTSTITLCTNKVHQCERKHPIQYSSNDYSRCIGSNIAIGHLLNSSHAE